MPDTHDAWETDKSSGFTTNYDGTVLDVWFATNPKVNDGQTLMLHLQTSIDALTNGDDVGDQEPIVQTYSCGGGWLSEDGGKTASHPKATAKFHASSLYGKLIDAVKGELEGYGDNATLTEDGSPVKTNLEAAFEVLKTRGQPTLAEVWKGCRFRFAEVLFDYGPDKKEPGKRIQTRRAMPIEYLGLADEDGAAKESASAPKQSAKEKAAAAKAKAAAAKAGSTANGNGASATSKLSDLGVDDALAKQVEAALTSSATHDAFIDACLAIDGVAENDALMESIVDDEPSGLFALKG